MPKIQFTKIAKEKPDKSATPSPTAPNSENREGVPEVSSEKAVRGVPENVRPKVGFVPEDEEESEEVLSLPIPTSTPKKRGRPKGSKNGTSRPPKPDTASISVEALTRQVQGIHSLANIVIPGMEISKEEANLMALAMYDVMVAYGFKVNEKINSLLTLAGVVGVIEAPKIPIVLHWLHSRQEETRRKKMGLVNRQPNGESLQRPPVEVPRPQEENSIFAHATNTIAKGSPELEQ